jgi:hypothetical protein
VTPKDLKGVLRLYRFSHPNIADVLYLFSTLHPMDQRLRQWHQYTDHGDAISWENFTLLATVGGILPITSIDEVPEEVRDQIPFCTEEWVPEANDYLHVDFTIRDFFS